MPPIAILLATLAALLATLAALLATLTALLATLAAQLATLAALLATLATPSVRLPLGIAFSVSLVCGRISKLYKSCGRVRQTI